VQRQEQGRLAIARLQSCGCAVAQRVQHDEAASRAAHILAADSRRLVCRQQADCIDAAREATALQQQAECTRERDTVRIMAHRNTRAAREGVQRSVATQREESRAATARRQQTASDMHRQACIRREMRLVAVVSRHRIWAEKRDLAKRIAAFALEGDEGSRRTAAVERTRLWKGLMEREQEQERELERQRLAACDAELIEVHCRGRDEREWNRREGLIEDMWVLRQVAFEQLEACEEAKRIDAVAAVLRAEEAAQHEAQIACNTHRSQERDGMLRMDALESDWQRKSVCMEQEHVWGSRVRAEQVLHPAPPHINRLVQSPFHAHMHAQTQLRLFASV